MDFDFSKSLITEKELKDYESKLEKAQATLLSGKEAFTGWVDLPVTFCKKELRQTVQTAEKIKKQCDVFVIIGVGGSYLGARACIEMLNHSFSNLLNKESRKAPQIFFAGHTISGTYYAELLDVIKDKDICLCVISKSGTTTEPNMAFSVLKEILDTKYGKSASERIYVITDKDKGILRQETAEKGYESFVVPDDIGGRYSVLSVVGLLPIAVAGIDIEEMLKGAADGFEVYQQKGMSNPCWQYAAIRNYFYQKGRIAEVFEYYEPKLQYFAEWLKQLFGESEGKENKGIFPASLQFSADLHSMGQFLQEGTPCFFETVLNVVNPEKDLIIPDSAIEMLRGKSINYINHAATEGVIRAHAQDRIPGLKIDIPKLSAYYFGKLVYFFEMSCALSAYLTDVNPFDQPGVEKYKKSMKELLAGG